MSVYLDVAFFINFMFDAQIILLTLTVISKKIVYPRIIFSAFLGGLQGVLVFFPYFRILSLPPVSFLVSLLMVFTAVNPNSLKELFEGYIFFLIASFLIGGAMAFLKLRVIFGLLLIFPLFLTIQNIRNKIFRKNTRVILCYKGKMIETNAVYDSGNTVSYFGSPVIFGSREIFREIMDKDIPDQEMLYGEDSGDLCLVTYKSMGKSGICAGIRLENAIVSEKNYEGTVICLFEGNLEDKVILNSVMV